MTSIVSPDWDALHVCSDHKSHILLISIPEPKGWWKFPCSDYMISCHELPNQSLVENMKSILNFEFILNEKV